MCAGLGMMADGAFAEFIIVPPRYIHKMPSGILSDDAALVEPLAVGLHALEKSGIKPGDKVVVVGAGAIGLSTM